jgi:PPOX class probable F420-dependent enzyme
VASTVTVVPEKFQDLLEWETKAYAHVATIGPDGAPQNNPVWFDWDGSRLLFSQTTTRQKLRNVERDPRVALSILDPDNPYRYLEVRGTVVDVQPDPDKAFIDRMAQKYLGEEKYPWNRPGDERVVLVVEPERTTSMG